MEDALGWLDRTYSFLHLTLVELEKVLLAFFELLALLDL